MRENVNSFNNCCAVCMHDKTINLLLMWPFSEIVWQISWLSMERVGLVGMEGGTGLIIIFPWAKTVPKNERKSAKNKDFQTINFLMRLFK